MGVGGSKCCKDLCSTEEVKPLVDPETGRVPRAGTSGRRDGKDEVKGGEGPNRDGPVEPDPAVFYARPVSKARSQRRLVNNDTARETASDRRETRARKHHHRSNQKVGEETVLRFHQENPAKAPIVASSSEDDIGSKPPSEVKGQDDVHIVHVSPAPSSAEKDGGKNWIGVCDAKLQHRVWWWSITFVLFFVIGMGVFLGLAHGYQPDHEDHPTSPLYPKVAVLDEESRHDTAVRHHHHRHEAPAATHAPGPDVSTQMLSEWESMDRMWSDDADAAWKGGAGDGDDAAELSKGWRARPPARSRKLTPGKSRLTPPTPATEERKLDSPLEDPALKADLNAAVSRLLRKEIESVGTDAPSTH